MKTILATAASSLLLAACGGGPSDPPPDTAQTQTPPPAASPSAPATTTPSAQTTPPSDPPAAPSKSTTAPITATQPTYSMIVLGDFRAASLNNHDDVVGDGMLYAYSSRSLSNLIASGQQGFLSSINDSGQIVGKGSPAGQQFVARVWYFSGGSNDIPIVVGRQGAASGASAISNGGWVTINSSASGWDDGMVQELADSTVGSEIPNPFYNSGNAGCNCFGTLASAVNDAGDVTGYTQFNTTGDSHAYLWKNGQLTDLGTLAGNSSSQGNGINSQDNIAGVSGQHAFLYHAGAMTDLGTLSGGDNSVAKGLNDSDEVVGVSGNTQAGTDQPFLYVNGTMYSLNTLASTTVLTEAVAINCNGDIAANGIDSNGVAHAYLLLRSGQHRAQCP